MDGEVVGVLGLNGQTKNVHRGSTTYEGPRLNTAGESVQTALWALASRIQIKTWGMLHRAHRGKACVPGERHRYELLEFGEEFARKIGVRKGCPALQGDGLQDYGSYKKPHNASPLRRLGMALHG